MGDNTPELVEPFFDAVSLDEGSDCETCGWNADELRVTQDEESGLYDVVATWGCYGGASAYDLTAGDAAAKVREIAREYGAGADYLGAVEIMAQGLEKRAEL